MKIVVISSCVFAVGPPRGLSAYGGLEVVAWECAKGLAAKGHQVGLVAPDGSWCPGCEMIPCGPPGGISEADAYDKYWKVLLQADVCIDHSWQKHSFLLKAEGRLKAPILAVCHAPVDTMFRELPEGVDKPCFVCISDDQKAHFDGLFSPVTARRVWNGIDLDFYRSTGVPRSDRFLFLARFSSIKGADLAVKACKEVGVGLDLVGDHSITNEPDYLKSLMAEADGKLIRFVGPCTRAESVQWFSQAHCLLHPNMRFREPLGLAPVEAMACGCPVVAWDYGAMRETIGQGCGCLVRSQDELVKAVQAAILSIFPDAREVCRENAKKFSLQRMVDGYEQLCREALAGGW